jgi:tetratricopeptide (TPR) repeat protein
MAEKTQPTQPQDADAPQATKTDLETFFRYTLPNLFKKHLDRILIFVLILAAASMVWRFRSNAQQQEAFNIAQSSAIAWETLLTAREQVLTMPARTEDEFKRQVEIYDFVEANVATVVEGSQSTDSQKASALLARGELNWLMANLVRGAVPSTQPSASKLLTEAAYLDAAEKSYRDILGPYASEIEPAFRALFGLAAVLENRGKFDEAKATYEKIVNHAQAPANFKEIASARIGLLPELNIKFLSPTPATRPSTQPSPTLESTSTAIDAPATQPVSPAVEPIVPAVEPTTRP